MENIVRLAEYRKRRGKLRPGAPLPYTGDGAQYFCTRCDSGEFRLAATGMIHCAYCGAMMRNLLVSSSSPEADR